RANNDWTGFEKNWAVMPSGGAEARSNAMAELEVHIHSLMTQPHLEDLFAQAEEETLATQERAMLREMKREWQLANLLPESLVQASSLAGSKCEHAWRTQRANNDWTGFEKNWAVMPSGGAEARSNAMAELEVHIHSLMTQPHLEDLFA
ncbi:hypothetical protein QTO04_29875, partial [Vibrio parahaemolyticus]